jgi:UDP-glucose 4-epimerase
MASKLCVLVTGGAGYIGSHAVYALKDHGYRVVVIDDLSTGVRDNLPSEVPLVIGNIGDAALVERTFKEHGVQAVMHFAGSIVVPESVSNPLKYYRNNTLNSQVLVETCVKNGVGTLLFSSTAAVYGIPEELPVREDTPTAPINPYGASKLMTEWVLRDTAAAHDFVYGALRYFNVAGADPQGRTGQSTPAATHLIKVACQTALGQRPALEIMGTDYPTPDGTGVRDYIHVTDLAEAHVLALDYLIREKKSLVLNCGYGHGFSVREVIKAVEAACGHALPAREAPRRAGDPPALTAQSERIRSVLGWTPKHDDLGFIVRTAFAWEKRLSGKV